MGDDVPKDQQGPPPAEAAKAETRLKGHLGHLTHEQETAFEQFKKLCIEEGLYTPATDEARASHDDGTLMYGSSCSQLSCAPLMFLQPVPTSSEVRSSRRLRPVQGHRAVAKRKRPRRVVREDRHT